MIKLDIPHYKILNIEKVIFDFNGTIGVDGKIKENVKELITKLAKKCEIYIATADTNGTTADECKNLPVKIYIFKNQSALTEKRNLAHNLIGENTVCFGNGNNDVEMFNECILSICVIGDEGASSKAIINSDIVVKSIEDGINVLLNENRIIADLRG
ncbi:MAG: HAD hydrolase family protein [Oscillospiraceae bacterium]